MKAYALILPFIEISLLRRNPQDLPANSLLLAMVMVAYVLTGLLAFTLYFDLGQSLVLIVLEAAMMVAIVSAMLSVAGVAARIPQTLTAFAGTSAFMTLVSMPLQSWIASARAEGELTNDLGALMLLLVIWSLAVTAHVLRHALSSALFVGLLLSVLYMWLNLQFMGTALTLVGAE